MSLDVSKIVSNLGDDLVAKTGEPLGLNRDQSVRTAHALAAHIGAGADSAVKQAAAETGLGEEVVSAMLAKLVETGKEKLLAEGPVGDAVNAAKAQAMGAMNSAGDELKKSAGGFLSGLFGRR